MMSTKDGKIAGQSSSATEERGLTHHSGATGRWEVVNVEERHGPMHNAIPVLPLPVALILCLFNLVAPGIGTLFCAPLVFCPGVTTRLGDNRLRAFGLNLVSSFLQLILFIIIVGWIWSIFWGMTFVTLSLQARKPSKPEKVGVQHNLLQTRRQSSVEATLSQRI